MSMRAYYTILLCSISIFPLFADALSGQIQQEGEPVSDANVVIVELNEISISDADGIFVFEDVPAGSYTVKVIAFGIADKDFAITIPSNDEIILELGEAPAVEEEVIVVTASAEADTDSSQRTFSLEEVQTLPLPNNNPFNLVLAESGVTPVEKDIAGPPFVLSPADGNTYALDSGVSVYGGDASWNKYYFNNIRIPTNYHPSNPLTSVVSREVVGGITGYKGIPPAQYIPTLGGSTVLTSIDENLGDIVLIGISPIDPRILFSYSFNEQWSLFTAARQSIANLTIKPIANKLADAQKTDNPANLIKDLLYGDFVLSLNYNGEYDRINITSLVFYDIIEADSREISAEDGYIAIYDRTIFGATGISWERFIGDSGLLALNGYFSLYDTEKRSDTSFGIPTGGDQAFKYNGDIRSYLYDMSARFTWDFGQNHVVMAGTELFYNDLGVKHTYAFGYTAFSPEGNDLPTVAFTGEVSLTEHIITNYYFLEYAYQTATLTLTNHAALTWLALHNTALPSLRSNLSWNFANKWNIAFTVGWGPAIIEGVQFLERRLTEETYRAAGEGDLGNYLTNTDIIPISQYEKPAKGVSNTIELRWDVSEKHSIALTPYLAYYYNFHGIYYPVKVADGTPLGTFLVPEMGITGGGSLEWLWENELNRISFSYTAATVQYYTSEYGWVPASTDTRHQLKFSYVLRASKYFNMGITASAYMDKPFTPYTMVANIDSYNTKEYGKPFSARSLAPSLSLIVNISGKIIDRKRISMQYRLASGDLLAGLLISDRLLASQDVGKSTANVADRKTEIEYLTAALTSGLEFALEITIKL